MGVPAEKLVAATYDDLRALPEHLVGEILAGELYASPRPAVPHARVSFSLSKGVSRFDGGDGSVGGWWILPEPELHLTDEVMVPDLAGWRRERLPELPDAPWMDLAPDWVCEILSPSTARIDRAIKMPLYAREGVRWMWLVDPRARTLEVFSHEGGRWVLLGVHSERDKVQAPPFEAAELDLAGWWIWPKEEVKPPPTAPTSG